jgi:transposase
MGQDTCASLRLGWADVVVIGVEDATDGVRQVRVVTGEVAPGCPTCGTVSTSPKGHGLTQPRDLPCGGIGVRLVWHKRRWYCRQGACPRRTFTESVAQIPARARMTCRLRRSAGAAVADGGRTVMQSARDHGLSWPVVAATFAAHATAELPAEPEPVATLGIDEVRWGRPRFAVDPDTGATVQLVDRWHTGFLDLSGNQGLLGQVEGRSAQAAGAWLEARPGAWRQAVRVVATDMCPAYRAAIRAHLPHAVHVVDHFHLVQLANRTVAEVRRRQTATRRGRRAHKDDPEYGIRRRLMRTIEDLSSDKVADMFNRLIEFEGLGGAVQIAYLAKEELRRLLALAGTGAARTPIGSTASTPGAV